jgi:hypothetical protein
MRTKSETSQIEPPTHTAQQLEQRRRLCEIVSAKGTPTGETLRELRRLQDALRGVFSDEGWGNSGVMLKYPF